MYFYAFIRTRSFTDDIEVFHQYSCSQPQFTLRSYNVTITDRNLLSLLQPTHSLHNRILTWMFPPLYASTEAIPA